MNVKQLIEMLETVEDKSLPVFCHEDGDFWDVQFVNEHDKEVHLDSEQACSTCKHVGTWDMGLCEKCYDALGGNR